jgi:hypothetical protein
MHTDEGLTPEVLHDLLMRSATAKAQKIILALDREDRDFWLDELGELVWRFADQVFSLEWDSGGPGAGAGTETVYRLADKYLTSSFDFGWGGPHVSLDDAYGTIVVTGATREIWCSEWTEEEIIARMELSDPPPAITINGTRWPFEALEHRHETLTGRKAG